MKDLSEYRSPNVRKISDDSIHHQLMTIFTPQLGHIVRVAAIVRC
jgi:hypothetical protein